MIPIKNPIPLLPALFDGGLTIVVAIVYAPPFYIAISFREK